MLSQFVAVRQQATEASSAGSRRACAVRSRQEQATEASSAGSRRASQFVAVRQQATEASSAGSRRACAVRSRQAASHRGELGGEPSKEDTTPALSRMPQPASPKFGH